LQSVHSAGVFFFFLLHGRQSEVCSGDRIPPLNQKEHGETVAQWRIVRHQSHEQGFFTLYEMPNYLGLVILMFLA
jgi:hypothetical protein